MLGPRVLASQTCEYFWLYDAPGRQVHAFLRCPPRRGLALSFLGLKSSVSGEAEGEAVPKGHCTPLRKFTSKYSNAFLPVRRLLSMSCPPVFAPWELQMASRAGARPE